MPVTDPLTEARRELALANRMVANEGVIDAFGHVSMRHPSNRNRYLLSRSRAPELVTPEDFVESRETGDSGEFAWFVNVTPDSCLRGNERRSWPWPKAAS